MGAKDKERRVHRLLDMVVEEVSLVDRAANKHRFLIVKRSEEMDETTTDTTTSPDETTAETNPVDGSEGAAPADTGDSSNDATGGAPLAVAVAALEGLTETVELLGTLGEDEAKPKLAELATELRGVSERLAQVAGGEGAEGGEDGASTDASDGTDAGEPAKDGAAFASVIEAVRATLQRVGSLLEADDDDQTGDESESGGAASSVDGGLAEQVTALVTELRALTDTVKEQQQRLARLEKRSGLPNSAPSGEQRTKPEGEDVGWPLDLNRPYDRESVDKAISFHDV